jgi:hypothetical protein
MIRSLRQRHRVTVIALSVAVPTAFTVGISTRRPVPSAASAPVGIANDPVDLSELWSRDDMWMQTPIQTHLLRDRASAERFAVVLRPRDPIVRPDLIVYWVPGDQPTRESLPDDSYLLGILDQSNPAPLILPAAAANQPGHLVLYSLADHEIVAASKPFASK